MMLSIPDCSLHLWPIIKDETTTIINIVWLASAPQLHPI